jgi:uncharacterized protein (DUF58 family)
VSYRLPTDRRGEIQVGPLRFVRADPLGVSRRVHRYGAEVMLLVRPKVHPLPLLASGRARQLEGSTSDRSLAGTVTFNTLREYVQGDDLRHIHWRTTARTGTLMIRQLVDASRPETAVVLDIRPELYVGNESGTDFELAVDVAASIAVAAARHGFPVRMLSSAGPLLTTGDGGALLDRLAVVRPESRGDLRTALELLRRSYGGGLLAVVSGRLDSAYLAAIASVGRRFDRVVLLRIGPREEVAPPAAGLTCIDVDTPETLLAGWARESVR